MPEETTKPLLTITVDEEWVYDILEDSDLDEETADAIVARICDGHASFDDFLDSCRSDDKALMFDTLRDCLRAFVNREAEDLLDGEWL